MTTKQQSYPAERIAFAAFNIICADKMLKKCTATDVASAINRVGGPLEATETQRAEAHSLLLKRLNLKKEGA